MNHTKFFLTPKEKELMLPLFVRNEKIEGFNETGITGINDLITYDMEFKVAYGSLGLICKCIINSFNKIKSMIIVCK